MLSILRNCLGYQDATRKTIRISPKGSVKIGGIAETQEVIDYYAARNIKAAEIESIRPEEINRTYERVLSKDVLVEALQWW